MTIYLDLLFLLNFFFDLLLLISVKLLLKRNIKFIRLLLGALLGSVSIFFLFLKINSIELFSFKILISLGMLLISFGYKNIRYFFKNFVSLYIVSFILGGFLYYLNVTFSYKQQGLIFFSKGLSVNFIFLVLISPVIIYIYIKENKILKNEYSNYYLVRIILKNNKQLNITGYLDTGNNLIDPISKKPVIIINNKILDCNNYIRSPIFVPIKTVNGSGLIECFKPKELYINNKIIKNVLVGIGEDFNLDNIDCLLNNQIKEILK